MPSVGIALMTEWLMNTHMYTHTHRKTVELRPNGEGLDLHPCAGSSNTPRPSSIDHNSQCSPLIRTQNGSAGSADMSDSCQLDQLSLRRLDSSLAVFHTGSGCTEVSPARCNHGLHCRRVEQIFFYFFFTPPKLSEN